MAIAALGLDVHCRQRSMLQAEVRRSCTARVQVSDVGSEERTSPKSSGTCKSGWPPCFTILFPQTDGELHTSRLQTPALWPRRCPPKHGRCLKARTDGLLPRCGFGPVGRSDVGEKSRTPSGWPPGPPVTGLMGDWFKVQGARGTHTHVNSAHH